MNFYKLLAKIFCILCLGTFICCKNSSNKNFSNKNISSLAKDTSANYTVPKIPVFVNTPEQRNQYMAEHYWDNFNFKDTVFAKSKVAERAFANYVMILYQNKEAVSVNSIKRMLEKAMQNDSTSFAFFVNLCEEFFYNPNSSFRNEAFYIGALEYITGNNSISQLDKMFYNHRLETVLKNYPGNMATNFSYTLKDGTSKKLYQIKSYYTIIYFNNPDCYDCKRVKDYISNSQVINKLLNGKIQSQQALSVLSLFIDEDLSIWRKTEYPKNWINAYDKNQIITNNQLYDLKAIPTLYLLDKDKKVVLKDMPIEVIEAWLNEKAL